MRSRNVADRFGRLRLHRFDNTMRRPATKASAPGMERRVPRVTHGLRRMPSVGTKHPLNSRRKIKPPQEVEELTGKNEAYWKRLISHLGKTYTPVVENEFTETKALMFLNSKYKTDVSRSAASEVDEMTTEENSPAETEIIENIPQPAPRSTVTIVTWGSGPPATGTESRAGMFPKSSVN